MKNEEIKQRISDLLVIRNIDELIAIHNKVAEINGYDDTIYPMYCFEERFLGLTYRKSLEILDKDFNIHDDYFQCDNGIVFMSYKKCNFKSMLVGFEEEVMLLLDDLDGQFSLLEDICNDVRDYEQALLSAIGKQ